MMDKQGASIVSSHVVVAWLHVEMDYSWKGCSCVGLSAMCCISRQAARKVSGIGCCMLPHLHVFCLCDHLLHTRKTSSHPTCYTFGSPPVLAHEQGGGGHRALQALGLPPDCVQNFVLENDPVPRAMLSVDPTFEMLKEWSAVKGLLHLRGLLAGQGSPLSPGRFLFESVGQVQLIKWTPEGEYKPLSPCT